MPPLPPNKSTKNNSRVTLTRPNTAGPLKINRYFPPKDKHL